DLPRDGRRVHADRLRRLRAGRARQRSRRLPGRAPARAPADLRGGLARPELRQHRRVQRARPGARRPPRRPPGPGRAVPRMTAALSGTAPRAEGPPLALVLLAGAFLAVVAAVLMGAVLLRLRGHYFAIATLGFMLVLQQLAANLELTGGGSGMNLPVAQSFTTFYYWMLGVCALAVAA